MNAFGINQAIPCSVTRGFLSSGQTWAVLAVLHLCLWLLGPAQDSSWHRGIPERVADLLCRVFHWHQMGWTSVVHPKDPVKDFSHHASWSGSEKRKDLLKTFGSGVRGWHLPSSCLNFPVLSSFSVFFILLLLKYVVCSWHWNWMSRMTDRAKMTS